MSTVTIIGELERLGRAADLGEISQQEAVDQFRQVADVTPAAAADLIKDWRGGVAQYEEWSRQVVEMAGHFARKAAMKGGK